MSNAGNTKIVPIEDLDPAYVAESNFGNMMAVNGTFHALAIIVLALRLYCRAVLVKSFSYDDMMMIAAWLFLFGGGMVTQIYAGYNGALGRHANAVTPDLMEVYGMMSFVQGLCMTVTANCLLKLSIGMSLLRLNSNKWYRRVVIGLIVFVICYMIEGWVTVLAYCDSVQAHWDKKVFATAKCYPLELRNSFGTMNTAFNIFTDVSFATIPIPMLWALQTRLRVRLYLVGIFNLGYITVGVGLAKMVCQLTMRQDPDKTFHNWVQFFGLLQLNVGIIAACAPMLKPLVSKTLKLDSYATGSGYPAQRASHYGPNSKNLTGPRRGPAANGYARDIDEDDDAFEMGKYNTRRPTRYQTTVVQAGGSDDGSETFILTDTDGGVKKTTEITVVSDLKK